jgi:hypothetical protein
MANLTGGQIQEVMDGLLYHCLAPIIKYTDAFDQQLTYMVHLIISNKKRRPYSCEKDNALTYIVKSLHCTDRDTKIDLVRKLKLERNFVYMFIQKFVERYYRPYMKLYAEFINGSEQARAKLEILCKEVGCKNRTDMYRVLTHCNRYLPEFKSYFQSIVNDYLLFCTQQAKVSLTASNGRNYDFGDLKQNFLRNVIVAINKYDCGRGALTGYIKFWIMNARTSGASEHEYGIAYIVPQTKRRDIANGCTHDVNFSISLDQQSDEEDGEGLHDKIGGLTEELDGEMDTSRKVNRLALLAKSADPYGVARLVMDLPEVFTPEETEKMRSICKTNRVN